MYQVYYAYAHVYVYAYTHTYKHTHTHTHAHVFTEPTKAQASTFQRKVRSNFSMIELPANPHAMPCVCERESE